MTIRLILVAFLALGSLLAQVDTGVLSGTVTDTSDAVVPGAKVELLNVGTNYKIETTTNAAGLYVSPPLPAGKYRIQTTASGFRAMAKEVQLNISERLAINFRLELGAVSEAVTVEALTNVLQTETVTLSTLRSDQEVKNLPNNGRNFSEIMRFSAGVTPSMSQRQTLPLSQIKGDTSHVVNGATMGDNNFLVDGIQNNSTHQGWGVFIFPELEAIDQYRVETSVPDARFGRTGGTLNVSYKSGTNEFHGVVFEFLRNDKLDARNFFAAGGKPSFRRNLFGGTFGGPIGGKDAKTFFFLSYEATRASQGATRTSTVPTPLMRDGNFTELLTSATPVTIYDPLTTRTNPAGAGLIRDPFPGNIIPRDRFDRSGKAVMDYFPLPNLPGLAGNLTIAPPQPTHNDQGTVKVDHDFTSGSRMFIRYTQGLADFVSAVEGMTLGPPANPMVNVHDPVYQLVVSHTQIISPNTVNQARIGFTRENLQSLNVNGGRNTALDFGIANVNVDNLTTGLPSIYVNGYPMIGDPEQNPAIIAMNNYQFADNGCCSANPRTSPSSA